MLDMISTVQQFAAGVKIIVWDLGWKSGGYVQKVSANLPLSLMLELAKKINSSKSHVAFRFPCFETNKLPVQ